MLLGTCVAIVDGCAGGGSCTRGSGKAVSPDPGDAGPALAGDAVPDPIAIEERRRVPVTRFRHVSTNGGSRYVHRTRTAHRARLRTPRVPRRDHRRVGAPA